jgi:glycosyltransferase involved in cell wall biosynthesis
MTSLTLHQFSEGVYVGDAVSDQLFIIRRWLREMGFTSDIYAERIQPELAGEVRPAGEYRPGLAERCLIHHHAVGSDVAERLRAIALPQILVYHNITPPEYFAYTDPTLAFQLDKGRRQLAEMRPRTLLALGDSVYNEREMRELGYAATGVLPIVLDESRYAVPLNEALAGELGSKGPPAAGGVGRPLVLFVGRLAPNKRQEDLIKLLHCLRRIYPEARLALVGSEHVPEYVNWQKDLARGLGLVEASVHFAGHVSQQDMVTYYRCADVYISMSEHEGFGKPLIESMYFGLPVLAYGSTAVPDTLGDAGILFYRKDYEALAELAALLLEEEPLRRRVIARQTRRVRAFLEPQVRRQWAGYLRQLDLLPEGVAP